jgi:hypothetical protein
MKPCRKSPQFGQLGDPAIATSPHHANFSPPSPDWVVESPWGWRSPIEHEHELAKPRQPDHAIPALRSAIAVSWKIQWRERSRSRTIFVVANWWNDRAKLSHRQSLRAGNPVEQTRKPSRCCRSLTRRWSGR